MTQAQAVDVLRSGTSVFLTGPPGSGKTYVLNEFVRRSARSGQRVAVTASTGIAATHINGMTLHAWSGLGVREVLSAADKAWLRRNVRLRKRYQATDILVIDEVSMLHGRRFDLVNEASKLLRGCDRPFGGMQLVLVGDLFQLPPVQRRGEPVDFVHTSTAWAELAPAVCYLSEQHRQVQGGWLELLEAMRAGALNVEQRHELRSRLYVRPPAGKPVTRLCSHRSDADAINERQLAGLRGKMKTYVMATQGNSEVLGRLFDGVLAPRSLSLRVGAEVMFVVNNPDQGFVNGSRGRVVGFRRGLPRVRLPSTRRTLTVEPYRWTVAGTEQSRAEIIQLPIRLAWAITIHKSQGMTLDAAEIDLRRAFLPGMGYVALSRLRSLDGVYLTGLNDMALKVHADIAAFDRQLRQASAALAAVIPTQPSANHRGDAVNTTIAFLRGIN